MDVNAVVAVCGGFVCLENEIKRKRRKIWCKNWLQNRNRFSHMSLLSELAANEPNDFKNYLRMTEDCFEDILGRISPEIEKQSTAMRESITSKERLAREHVGCPHRRPSMSVLALGLAGSDEPSAEPNMFAGPKAGRPHTRASMFAANTVTNMLANMLARVWGA
ncbi:hypothetical protein GE061_001556 [Apolygus lucorum]|uniref:Uncharacterized protein n=1 Tax=Apolygus lucorum TaxID=248454 RepID=A0A8S9Y7E5_APOLU|nr:hypothetical protein GE061_001556 [Apolygus lucorum]